MNACQEDKTDTVLATEEGILISNISNKTECFTYKGGWAYV